MLKRLQRPAPGLLTSTVTKQLREQIAAGLISPGECVPSERDLSRSMRVSRVTVRRGLDQLVRDGLLRREPGRGYFLRDASAPASVADGGNGNGARAKRGAVVFVHAHPESDLAAGTYHARMWAGAREEAARAGLLTMISSIAEGTLTAERAGELASVSAGVLCDYINDDAMRTMLQAGIPVVQIDYYRGGLSVDAVVQDDIGGITLAVEHLYSRGHRKIGFLDTSAGLRAVGHSRNAEMRLAGFQMICARLGVDAGCVAPADLLAADAAAGTEQLLARGVTAMVIPHNELWPSARMVLAGKGIALPGDFGVVTWGEPVVGRHEGFPTSVTWNKEQMGREATRRLLLRRERPDIEPASIVIPAVLVDRGTGGRGPEAK